MRLPQVQPVEDPLVAFLLGDLVLTIGGCTDSLIVAPLDTHDGRLTVNDVFALDSFSFVSTRLSLMRTRVVPSSLLHFQALLLTR